MMFDAVRVLLVEDDDDDHVLVAAMTRELPGWTLERVSTSAEALERLGRPDLPRPDVCLVDLRLDAQDGIDVLTRARAGGFSGPVLMLTGAAGREAVGRALAAGAADFLVKGAFDAGGLDRAVRFALANRRLADAQVARAEAEAAMRTMDELVATLSHELRAPLHTMRLAIEAVTTNGLDESARARARTLLERGLVRLSRTVEDLLDAARLHRGELAVECSRIDLCAVAERAVEALRVANPGREITLHAEPPVPIEGDAIRLEQVVENLVGNALRHAPNATITVSARAADGIARLRVEDDGPGFPPVLLERIFERYTKSDVSRTRAGGLGLGLSIVRALAEAHGGRALAANDGPRGGAAVTVELPSGDG